MAALVAYILVVCIKLHTYIHRYNCIIYIRILACYDWEWTIGAIADVQGLL